MKKVLRIIKKTFKILFILAIVSIFYSFGYTSYENIKVSQDFKTFKNRAVYEKTVTLNNGMEDFKRHYYKVSRETSFELNDTRSVFRDDTEVKLGQKGDIFVTKLSPFKNVFGAHQFVSYYFGGHAAIYDGEKGYIEAVGFPDDFKEFINIIRDDGENVPNYSTTVNLNRSDYWTHRSLSVHEDNYYKYYYRPEVVGLRIKDVDSASIDAFVDNAYEKYEDNRLYNFLFFLDMKNKYYCTDLVSRAYTEVIHGESKGYAKELNDDGFITSVNDLILSKQTYITFIFEVKEENDEIVEYLYYLEDI